MTSDKGNRGPSGKSQDSDNRALFLENAQKLIQLYEGSLDKPTAKPAQAPCVELRESKMVERRKHPRFKPAGAKVLIQRYRFLPASFGNSNVALSLIDLSQGGIRCTVRERLDVGIAIWITLSCGRDLPNLKIQGRIVWGRQENGLYESGIAFVNPPSSAIASIGRLQSLPGTTLVDASLVGRANQITRRIVR